MTSRSVKSLEKVQMKSVGMKEVSRRKKDKSVKGTEDGSTDILCYSGDRRKFREQ